MKENHMTISKKRFSNGKTNVLLLWKRGEKGSLLEDVDVTVYQDGVVHIHNTPNKEKLTTHISNVVIIAKE
jgi:hypothetical protein